MAEEAILERRAYGKTQHREGHGECTVLSVRQPLRDISSEQMKVHTMVNDEGQAEARRTSTRRTTTWARAQPVDFDVKSAMKARRAGARRGDAATIKLGLQRVAHTYGRAKGASCIPPGYYDVAHRGSGASVKEAGAIA